MNGTTAWHCTTAVYLVQRFLPFSVSHSLFLFRSFLSFRLVVFRLILESPSSLVLSFPCFPWSVADSVFCYLVSAIHPPRAPCEREVCVFQCMLSSFLRCWCWLIFVFFFTSFPFSISIWTSFVFTVFFLWVLCCLLDFGFCCDSFSIFMIIQDTRYVSWYVHTLISPFYFCLRYTKYFGYCVYYLLLLFVFLLR